MDGAGTLETNVGGGDYRALFDETPIPIALVSVRGEPRFVAASRGFLTTVGLRRVDVVGRPVDEVLIGHGDGLVTAINRCLVTTESVHTNAESRGEGSRRFIGIAVHQARARGFSNHVILEADGRSHAVHTFAQRITSVHDQMGGDGRSLTYVHDLRSQRIRYADSGLAKRLGLTGGALHFRDFEAMVHPEDLAYHPSFAVSRDVMDDDEYSTQTIRVRDREGEWRLISARTRVLRRRRDGTPRLVLGTVTDITDYAVAAVEAAGVSLLHAEQNERARIGRELHDSTSQHLVAADLGLSRVLRTAELSEDARTRLEGVRASVSMAQTEMRAFAYFLHPPELREMGLFRAVERFCSGFARRSELEIAFRGGPQPEALSSEAEHALFRVCQEALMNVYRHAFAHRVAVRLEVEGEALVLEVRDDGIGVDGAERFELGGMGVAGMRSRMNSVGGELILDYLGPGLSVKARAPLSPSGAAGMVLPAPGAPAAAPAHPLTAVLGIAV